MSLDECTGNSPDHCCWFKGQVCPFLEEHTIDGRRWACGLLRVYKDWDSVLASEEYTKVVQLMYDTIPQLKVAGGVNCRDWPEGPDSLDIAYDLYRDKSICYTCMNAEERK